MFSDFQHVKTFFLTDFYIILNRKVHTGLAAATAFSQSNGPAETRERGVPGLPPDRRCEREGAGWVRRARQHADSDGTPDAPDPAGKRDCHGRGLYVALRAVVETTWL